MLFATVIVSVRLNARVALFVTLPEPSEPLVEPAPIWSVPPSICVRPV